MREEINNWMNSQKFKDLRNSLDKKRKEFLNLNFSISLGQKNKIMDKVDLKKIINDCNTYQLIDDVEKIKRDKKTKVDQYYMNSSFEDLLEDYVRDICIWASNIKLYINREDYELCAEMRDCMFFEEREFVRLIGLYNIKEESMDELDDLYDVILNVIPSVQKQYKLC
jgi:ribosomal protein L29